MLNIKKHTSNDIYKGLTKKNAEEKIKKNGYNELTTKNKASPMKIFFSQFKDFITLTLLSATAISFFLGEVADAITIIIIIAINAILGFVQEYKTERSLEALSKLNSPNAKVVRDEIEMLIPAREVVIDDLIILEAGDRTPCDCVLIEGVNIACDEAMLTGESVPVEKKLCFYAKEDIKQENMLYMGTIVTSGRGKAIAVKTGMSTEMGKIANMLDNITMEETHLKKQLDKIGKELVIVCLGVCVVIILAGIYHGESLYNMFFSGVSLAVAAIPEGLPAIVTACLAIGVQRMLKRNALVRKLPAVETLGSINVICSDKTGTLTENKMTVKKAYVNDDILEISGNGYDLKGEFLSGNKKITTKGSASFNTLLTIGSLCNNAQVRKKEVYGDPTEIAILIASIKSGVDVSSYQRVAEISFDSDRKLMSVICKNTYGDLYLFVKGAPDKIISVCTGYLSDTGVRMFSEIDKKNVTTANELMAKNALRVLGFAFKKLDSMPANLIPIHLERNLIFAGLEGMIDPPRQDAIGAVRNCYKAGIKPIMITGDHKITAVAVANEVGINVKKDGVLTGEELEKMSDEQIEKSVNNINVYARVTPLHKLRIVKALKKNKNIVAMTGDGVNDAPALKEADIGIAMGKTGTDVAKEASAMVLLDDNFSTIVAAIEEGRMIFENIRKFIRYLLSCNLGEIFLMGMAAFYGMTLPLIPIQILWLNLVTDGLPALALGVDPADKDIMLRKPLKNNEGIFSKGLGGNILLSGLIIGAASLLAFITFMNIYDNLIIARTATLATMIVAELLYAFECRSEKKSIFQAGIFKNPALVVAVSISFMLMFVVIYTPFLSKIFGTTPLTMEQWLMVGGFGIIEFVLNSILLLFKRK